MTQSRLCSRRTGSNPVLRVAKVAAGVAEYPNLLLYDVIVSDGNLRAPVVARIMMKLVVFDMGHVFINFSWDAVCHGFAKRAGIPREEFGKILEIMSGLGYEKGKITTKGFLSELNRLLKVELNAQEFTQLWNATFEEDKDMRALMDKIAQRWPLYLLSNTNENHFSYLQERFDVARNFRELILSHEVGYCKPEHEIYAEVCKRSGYAPPDCLLIDDLEPNIESAQQFGMKTILYRGIGDLQSRLPNFGVTV